MHELAPLIYDLALMLGLASIVIIIFQKIHQPVVLGYLVAGLIIGPHTPPHSLIRDIGNIKTLSELGVIFLMFSLGLEFSFQKLARVGFSASVTGTIEVLLMTFIGYVVGRMMGWSVYNALFLGAALSISSTTIIIKAIDELQLKTKRFAELIFGVLIVEDLLAILLLVGLSTIVVTHNVFSFDMIDAIIRLVLVVGTWFLVGYFLVPSVFRRLANYISQETLTIVSIALCLLLVCIAATFNYSAALGAFIMGSILAETVLVHRIEDLIRPIRDIFAAVFFISVGMLIDPSIIVKYAGSVVLIAFVTVIGKILTTTAASLLTGQSVQTSVRVGFSMAQIGEFSFIIAALGLSLGVTDHVLYPVIVAVSAVTTFTTPYLIRLSGYLSAKLDKKLPIKVNHILNLYAVWLSRRLASKSHFFFRQMGIRIFINAIIIAVIFTLIHYLVFHYFAWYIEHSWKGNTIFLIVALALSSPFIWGMVFAHKDLKTLDKKSKGHLLLYIATSWLIAITEITLLSFIYFYAWSTILILLTLAAIFFMFSYRRLGIFYRWFENQLVSNIKNNYKEQQYKNLAPWDTHFLEVTVSENAHFAGKLIQEAQIRELYGVNIVAIQRKKKLITTPRGEEKILSQDKLIVLGDDEQLEVFRSEAEISYTETISHDLMSDFRLKSFLIERDHDFIGKTIKETGLREEINGLVVGIERQGLRIINPNSTMVIESQDLLLLVGELDMLKKLKKRYFSSFKTKSRS